MKKNVIGEKKKIKAGLMTAKKNAQKTGKHTQKYKTFVIIYQCAHLHAFISAYTR